MNKHLGSDFDDYVNETLEELAAENEKMREALRKASKTLDALGFAMMDGDKTIVSREAWSEAMAMRDEIDMEFFNSRKALAASASEYTHGTPQANEEGEE